MKNLKILVTGAIGWGKDISIKELAYLVAE